MKLTTIKRQIFVIFVIFAQIFSSQMCAESKSEDMNSKFQATEKNNEGIRYLQAKDIGKAKELFEEAFKLDGTSPEYPSNIGYCYLISNQLDEAEKYFKKSLNVDSRYFRAHYNMGVLLQTKGDIENAKESYAKAVNSNPSFPEANYNLALMYMRLGQKKSAIEYFEKFISVASPDMQQPVKDAKQRIIELKK
ncbi:tetratricopeptide repeat protein [Leptospira idonii]|uniref:Tetratricopeptide repeat protein n=1 Tax=Leptospira idonii TaxID=1193500 RepID=A0A4R9M1T0_9LEPT|nr:tetratricopeptide repeat protein [Leptospira idonii]TGN19795.1 tetratricopeptide repeat protein [Leptospira idonii]